VLVELLEHPPPGFRVEPVEAILGGLGYRYARGFTERIQGKAISGEGEDRIDVAHGDIFFGLDFNTVTTVEQSNYLKRISEQGVKVVFFLHDLLSVERPDVFVRGNEANFRRWLKLISEFDGVISNSKSTMDSYARWLKVNRPRSCNVPELDWVHLGSDIESSLPSRGLPAGAVDVLRLMESKPTFLMVGTVEPRKGYRQTIDAFEQLWRQGLDVNLVIVGHHGWKVDALVSRIRSHAEFGVHLLWLEGISDEYLAKVYAASDCLIAASEAEGFGLPIVEAARHGLPLIARDIPVFRELAGEHALYFSGMQSNNLADAVEHWLHLCERGEHPRSTGIRWLTWKETAARIVEILLRDACPGPAAPARLGTLSPGFDSSDFTYHRIPDKPAANVFPRAVS
jgi:glycosyltransferase involved in cell wall biosynthesis